MFTIIGLHVFGGLPLPPDKAYPNYDTFLNALLSTFNALNLENWNQQMYAVASASNSGAASFFVLWIVIGKYTLLSLFLAVMLEAFEASASASSAGKPLSGPESTLSRTSSTPMPQQAAGPEVGAPAPIGEGQENDPADLSSHCDVRLQHLLLNAEAEIDLAGGLPLDVAAGPLVASPFAAAFHSPRRDSADVSVSQAHDAMPHLRDAQITPSAHDLHAIHAGSSATTAYAREVSLARRGLDLLPSGHSHQPMKRQRSKIQGKLRPQAQIRH